MEPLVSLTAGQVVEVKPGGWVEHFKLSFVMKGDRGTWGQLLGKSELTVGQ